MISLDLEHVCLLELIKTSLFGYSSQIPENVNWENVFESAKNQCIVPLVSSFVPISYRSEWLNFTYASKAHYMHMLYEQDSLIKLFNVNKIPFFIFKGTAAAVYYPNPALRTFGDVDFYVPEASFDSAKILMQENNYIYTTNNDRHYSYEKNGITFELHNRISRKGDYDIDHIVLNDYETFETRINNICFPTLSVYKNGLILLWHIMHHLKVSGIGLRQIIDWMMFVHNALDDLAWNDHFRTLAVEAGLEKLAITVTYMCKKWLGLPDDITWCNNADEELADRLLVLVLDDGNFGRDRAPYEKVKKSMKKEGVIKYLFSAGIENWPLAQKYPVFKPFALFFQLCRYLIKLIIGFFTGKKMFMKDKNSMSLEEFWERLE